ncbi:MAG TPA: FAD-dependent oxidoreductase [Steroidobacteraceae bacterium]|nr:FAD-dependent oxidoreductase [Steroidobacteraceae bacterium]HRX88270.1 FAD-dependent oxidoreductase [Steroidobacteraceae bacterium]
MLKHHNKNISRRGFNVALASSLVGSVFARPAVATDSADVIVVGAGLAGLNAALILEEQGMSVIVLEAADYVGGRTRTFDLPVGPTNAGGQTVGPLYGRLRDLIARLRVPLVSVGPSSKMGIYINSSLMPSSDWSGSKANRTVGPERSIQPGALEFFYLTRDNPLPDPASWIRPEFAQYDVPLSAYLQQLGASDEARRLINVSINAFDLSSCSALGYLRDIRIIQSSIKSPGTKTRSTYDAGGASNEIAGGTQRLPEAMARALKHEVRLNQEVASVDMAGNSVEVTTMDGNRYRGKYAIAALPLSALRNIDIYPNFSGAQLDVVHRSAHGNTLRVFMEHSAPFWESDIGEAGLFTDTALERVFAHKNESGEVYVIDCWVNGNAANRLDQMPTAAVGEFVVAQLARIRPSTKGRLQVLKVHSWAKHSASSCCRHVFNAGEVGPWAGVVATPHRRLHLAGEQTRSLDSGMEAAAETGERAALEILARES